MDLEHPIPVRFIEVSVNLPDVYPRVLLQEIEAPYRVLRFSIGTSEAISIAMAQKNEFAPRPLTHDLIQAIFDEFEIKLEAVRILKLDSGNFGAQIILSSSRGGNKLIDARPSDALALALRQPGYIPIVVEEKLLEGGADESTNKE